MDRNTGSNKDEEYHFPDEPQIPSVFSGGMGSRNPALGIFEKIKRKNILIALGLIFTVFVVYRSATLLMTDSPRAHAPAVKPAAVVIAQPPVVAQQPVAAVPPAATASNELSGRLSKNEDAILQLQAGVTGLQEQMASMTTALQDLSNQLKQTQAAAAEKKTVAKKKNPAKRDRAMKPATSTHYFVKAIIPGRAWLILPNGATTTVVIGDTLGDYGKVTDIDYKTGIVTTDSGQLVRANPDDR